jgi:Uma2 family endonuclease
MGEGKPHPGRRMTEAEFVEWCDHWTHAEWVDGEVILMAPDNSQHNRIVRFLTCMLDGFTQHHKCGELLIEKVQVRFAGLKRRREPDLCFITTPRLKIIKTNHVEGAPDIVVEVVSPDCPSRDYRDKFIDYEAGGVKEYWIIDPLTQHIELYTLGPKKRYVAISEKDGKLHSKVLRGFYLKPEWLWQEPLPSWLRLLKELGVTLE